MTLSVLPGSSGRAVDRPARPDGPSPSPASGPITAVGGFERAMQRGAGYGLTAFLIQSVLQSVIGRELYPRWWWLSVAPLTLGIALGMIALCLTGRLQPRWAVAAAVPASVCFVLTSVATAGSTLVEGTGVTGIAMGMSGLLGFVLVPRWAVPLGGMMITSSLTSILLTRPGVHPDLVAITAIQFALLGLGLVQGAFARRTTAAEDEAIGRLRRALIADRAAAAARADRRELERRLHDTVLNTLTALGRAGITDSALLRARCAADAAFLRDLRRAANGVDTDLSSTLRRIAEDNSDESFAVIVTGAAGDATMPARAVAAMAAAVQEAVTNARQHSGAPAAVVHVRASGAGSEVTVLDRGRGPATDVGQNRLGIRRSIVDRMADVGGYGHVAPADGGGTEAMLRWPR